jgi:Scaffold protein Nfu/NifU N terminal
VQQQRGMFIQTQPTPNPSSLMFMPGQAVMEVRVWRLDGSTMPRDVRLLSAQPLADCLPGH